MLTLNVKKRCKGMLSNRNEKIIYDFNTYNFPTGWKQLAYVHEAIHAPP